MNLTDAIESLAAKAESATNADDALKYSQAALNLANAALANKVSTD
jgi:hypothetical protein